MRIQIFFLSFFILFVNFAGAQAYVNDFCNKVTNPIVSGTKGENVALLQKFLANKVDNKIGITGFFGNYTSSVLNRYQQSVGFKPSGSLGPLTLAKIRGDLCNNNAISISNTQRANIESGSPSQTVTPNLSVNICTSINDVIPAGAQGQDVKALQIFLSQKVNSKLSATGFFGNLTSNALKQYQQKNGIYPSGSLGPQTLAKVRGACEQVVSNLPQINSSGQLGNSGGNSVAPVINTNSQSSTAQPNTSFTGVTGVSVTVPSQVNNEGIRAGNIPFMYLAWTKGVGPILSKSSAGWDSHSTYAPRILKNSDGTAYKDLEGNYYVYYTATDGATGTDLDQTGLARTKDFVNWTKLPYPVLSRGPAGSTDNGDASIVSAIHDNGKFHAFSEGNSTAPGISTGDNVTINYSESKDGLLWNKSASNPILKQGNGGDVLDLYAPAVMKDGSLWKMWYTGSGGDSNRGVLYATASNPSGPWTKYSNDYVLTSPLVDIFPSEVWKESGLYYMTYSSGAKLIYATSEDGISWTERGTFLERGPGWDAGAVSWPSTILENGVRRILYNVEAYTNKNIGMITENKNHIATKLAITYPTTGTRYLKQKFGVSGTCKASLGNVSVSINGAKAFTTTCLNDIFSSLLPLSGINGSAIIVASQGIASDSVTVDSVNSYQQVDYKITKPKQGEILYGRVIPIEGNCQYYDGDVYMAVGYDIQNTKCLSNNTFSGSVNYTGNSGTVGIGIKGIKSGSYKNEISTTIDTTRTPSSTGTTTTPQTTSSPAIPTEITSHTNNQQILGTRSINFSGKCDPTKGTVYLVLGYQEVKDIVCNIASKTFTTVLNYTGNAGNIALGVKMTTAPSYEVNMNLYLNPDLQTTTVTQPTTTPQTTSSPAIPTEITSHTNNQQILGTRSINFSGKCDPTKGTVYLVLGYQEVKDIVCNIASKTFTTVLNYTGNAGNIALGVKMTTAPSYEVNMNLYINPDANTPNVSSGSGNEIVTPGYAITYPAKDQVLDSYFPAGATLEVKGTCVGVSGQYNHLRFFLNDIYVGRVWCGGQSSQTLIQIALPEIDGTMKLELKALNTENVLASRYFVLNSIAQPLESWRPIIITYPTRYSYLAAVPEVKGRCDYNLVKTMTIERFYSVYQYSAQPTILSSEINCQPNNTFQFTPTAADAANFYPGNQVSGLDGIYVKYPGLPTASVFNFLKE